MRLVRTTKPIKIKMKKLITIIAATAITITAQAELKPSQFAQLKAWAEMRGYSYKGTIDKFGTPCFAFSNATTNVSGLVPVSSDTADEAINALIASTITYREAFEMAKQAAKSIKTDPEITAQTAVKSARQLNPKAAAQAWVIEYVRVHIADGDYQPPETHMLIL